LKKVIVCIKEVPDAKEIEIDLETGLLKREKASSIINPSDETALSYALELKKNHGFSIIVLSMGPKQTETVLQYILSLGFDEAFLLSDPFFSGSDTWATAFVLSEAIRFLGGADFIFFGHQSLDGDTGQVPNETAEILQIPSFTHVLNFSYQEGKSFVCCQFEDIIDFEAESPFTVSFIENEKSEFLFPEAKNYFNGEKKVQILDSSVLKTEKERVGLLGSPTQVKKVETALFQSRTPDLFNFDSKKFKNFYSDKIFKIFEKKS